MRLDGTAHRELENHKRELDIAHHSEVASHLTRAEAAERSLALANQDRDQALQDTRVLEDEKASLTQQLREIRAGKDTEMSKITGPHLSCPAPHRAPPEGVPTLPAGLSYPCGATGCRKAAPHT